MIMKRGIKANILLLLLFLTVSFPIHPGLTGFGRYKHFYLNPSEYFS